MAKGSGTVLIPVAGMAFTGDEDTLIKRPASNNLVLTAGGVDVVSCFNTNLLLNISNTGLATVTKGAADSGGVGFSLLRVPN